MSNEELPKITRLISKGYNLDVSLAPDGNFHAAICSGKLNGPPNGYHILGKSVTEAITRLEDFVKDSDL